VITLRAMGSIMIVVAVFDTHMLSAAVISMNPPTSRCGSDPTPRRTENANRLWRSHRCMESARMNPPMKRKISSCAYGAAASLTEQAPAMGSTTSGRSAVTETGMASVIHQVAIHTPSAAVTRPA
jgi:hypothetical protein